MRSRWLLGLAAVILAITAALAFSGCTTILGTFDVLPAGTGMAEGTACDAGSQCSSTFCSDGVCCEAACSGTCESCNLPGSVGKCAPIPDGQDPQIECPTVPLVTTDASAPPIEDAGPDDGGVLEAGAGSDAGATFGFPDGGISTNDNQCGGSCNGQRACKFPGTDRTCGTTFCSTPTQQGRASCDAKGHCLVGQETCEAYSCTDGTPGCKASCAAETDCLGTHFCDALSSTCKPKLGNGSACTSVAQCQQGHCVEGVCCNDGCTGFPGATCVKPGHIGECSCTACATGACQLYYRDEDGDGYGDKNGTIGNTRAAPGCVGQPPAGFVADNTDCLDGPATFPYNSVHPGQTAFFSSPYAGTSGSSFDYDCNAALDKQFAEYPGQGCGFCRNGGSFVCNKTTSCSTVGEAAGLGCSFGFGGGGCGIRLCASCSTTGRDGAFSQAVDCGASATLTDCGTCNGATIVGSSSRAQVQGCH